MSNHRSLLCHHSFSFLVPLIWAINLFLFAGLGRHNLHRTRKLSPEFKLQNCRWICISGNLKFQIFFLDLWLIYCRFSSQGQMYVLHLISFAYCRMHLANLWRKFWRLFQVALLSFFRVTSWWRNCSNAGVKQANGLN